MGTVYTTNTIHGGVGTQTGGQTAEGSSNRTEALQKFKLIMVGQLLLGVGLLVCGIIGIVHFDSNTYFGPPYFIGAMVAGPMLLLGGLSSFMLQRHAVQYENSDTAKQQARCDMQGIQITTMFSFMGCFVGFVMLGISGALTKDRDCYSCHADPYEELNRSLAIAICVLLVATFLFSIGIMYIYCTTAGSFGVIIQNRRTAMIRQQQLMVTQIALNQQMMMQQQQMGGGVFAGSPNAQATSDLQRQNELLQQQILLMQQQQQQQQQSGFSQPPPPPSYETVAGFK